MPDLIHAFIQHLAAFPGRISLSVGLLRGRPDSDQPVHAVARAVGAREGAGDPAFRLGRRF